MNWSKKLRVFGVGNPFQLSVMKRSSLLSRFVIYEENGVLWIRLQHFMEFHRFTDLLIQDRKFRKKTLKAAKYKSICIYSRRGL
jgi:hypothetical protein